MGAYRYCRNCQMAQDRITLEEIEMALISGPWNANVQCEHCHTDRDDDTSDERFSILLSEFMALRDKVNER